MYGPRASSLVLSFTFLALAGSARATQIASFAELLQASAALVDGTVSAGYETFDSTDGPRRVATVSNVVARLGVFSEPTATLKLLGGPIPEVGTLVTDFVPNLAIGYRYLVLLYTGEWFASPVPPLQAYLVTVVLGQEVVIDPTGHAVLGFDENGAVLSDAAILQMNDEVTTPFAAPVIAPGIVMSDMIGALNADGLVAALQAFMNARGVTLSGSFVDDPYNFGAIQPDALAGDDQACPNSCADQTYYSPNGEAP